MGVGNATFRSAGQISQHVIPGGYSRISAPAGNVGGVNANRIVIVGQATGGKPNEVMWFTTINDAINTLRSGDLLDGVRFALNAGGGLVPQMVGAIRVNSATQAVSTLQDALSADVINLKSKDYGLHTNSIKYTISNATTTGKKIVVTKDGVSETIDNIFKESIVITYTGDATTAVLATTATGLTITLAGDQTDGTLNASALYSTYDTIEKLVGYLNSLAGYTVTLVDGVDGEDLSSELDIVSAISVLTAYTANSDGKAMVDAINNFSNYLEATAIVANYKPVVNVADVYLTGAVEGSAGSTEHTSALTTLEQEDVQAIATTSGVYAIQALYKTHVTAMNAVTGKKERQVYLGATSGDTLATAIAEAKVKNELAVCQMYCEFKDYDLNGVEKTYASPFFACKMLGQFGALDIIQPHTFKEFSANSLVTKLTTSEKEEAIRGGLWVAEISPQGTFRTVRSVTTYQKENLIYNESSMVRTALYASRDLRNYLEVSFVGQAGDTSVLASIETLTRTRLNSFRNDLDLFVDNPNEGWNNEAWKNLVISVNGDQVSVTYDATVTAPINFVFITNQFGILVTL